MHNHLEMMTKQVGNITKSETGNNTS